MRLLSSCSNANCAMVGTFSICTDCNSPFTIFSDLNILKSESAAAQLCTNDKEAFLYGTILRRNASATFLLSISRRTCTKEDVPSLLLRYVFCISAPQSAIWCHVPHLLLSASR